jgi:hypothetical protein
VRRASGAVAFGLALSACNHASKPTSAGCCDQPEPSRGDLAGDSRDPDAASTLVTSTPRFRRDEGCTRDFSPSGTASQDIARLERLCAQGLAPVLTEPISTSSAGGISEVPFRLGSASCFRAAAVTGSGGLALSLVDAHGNVLAATTTTEAFSLVPSDGTVCVREGGAYRVIVRQQGASKDAAQTTVQIWQASRD